MKVMTGRLKLTLLTIALAILAVPGYLWVCWESMDSLDSTPLATFGMLDFNVDSSFDMTGGWVPSGLKDRFWKSRGRQKLYFDMLGSPEQRILVLNSIDEGRRNGWPMNQARVQQLLEDVASAEARGVRSIERLPPIEQHQDSAQGD
jgi:hypothetical protein